MKATSAGSFERNYQSHLKHLKLKGLQPKTIDAYSRAIRRVGEHFDFQIDDLSAHQLTDYFTALVASHSWSTVKLDLYGLQFYYKHVLRKPWVAPGLILTFAPAGHGRRRVSRSWTARHDAPNARCPGRSARLSG